MSAIEYEAKFASASRPWSRPPCAMQEKAETQELVKNLGKNSKPGGKKIQYQFRDRS
jgi:hypothetical protein